MVLAAVSVLALMAVPAFANNHGGENGGGDDNQNALAVCRDVHVGQTAIAANVADDVTFGDQTIGDVNQANVALIAAEGDVTNNQSNAVTQSQTFTQTAAATNVAVVCSAINLDVEDGDALGILLGG